MTLAVFTNAPFVELAARAEREDTLLLVDFTAGWCAPCQAMDATTWTDPLIEDWIRRNALAVQVDVDVDQATARHFAVSTMPTLVLLRGGCVLDRISGARPTAALISWLEATANGTSALDVQRAQLDPRDVQSRFAFARALLEAGRLDEATSHLEFLWLEGARLEPSWSGVRASYLVLVIAQLVDASPRARRRFEALRDAAQPRADDAETTRDWLALNEALNEGDRTLAWFEALRGQPPEWLRAEPRLRELLTSRATSRPSPPRPSRSWLASTRSSTSCAPPDRWAPSSKRRSTCWSIGCATPPTCWSRRCARPGGTTSCRRSSATPVSSTAPSRCATRPPEPRGYSFAQSRNAPASRKSRQRGPGTSSAGGNDGPTPRVSTKS